MKEVWIIIADTWARWIFTSLHTWIGLIYIMITNRSVWEYRTKELCDDVSLTVGW